MITGVATVAHGGARIQEEAARQNPPPIPVGECGPIALDDLIRKERSRAAQGWAVCTGTADLSESVADADATRTAEFHPSDEAAPLRMRPSSGVGPHSLTELTNLC